MIALAHPWLALLLPAPLLVHWLLPPYRQAEAGVRVPFFAPLVRITGTTPEAGGVAAAALRLAPDRARAVLGCSSCWR